jgi:fructosamine-3-kinase
MWNQITEQIADVTGQPLMQPQRQAISGGSINQAYVLRDGQQSYFVKLNHAAQVAMFEAEASGLREIRQTRTIRVPQPICWGTADGSSYLVLEWIELGRGEAQAWEKMGQQLAALHRVSGPQGFGWHQNNTIGLTPQPNPWTANWTEFFTQHRIEYQLQLARRRGGHFPRHQALLAVIPKLLAHQPEPALVHGDLWSGNAAYSQDGEPVLLDPAVYYGDREVDLAAWVAVTRNSIVGSPVAPAAVWAALGIAARLGPAVGTGADPPQPTHTADAESVDEPLGFAEGRWPGPESVDPPVPANRRHSRLKGQHSQHSGLWRPERPQLSSGIDRWCSWRSAHPLAGQRSVPDGQRYRGSRRRWTRP